MSVPSRPFEAFFEAYAALEPEEVTTLGLDGHEHELRDMSVDGEAARRRLREETLAALEDLGADAAEDVRLDADTLRRHLELERHLDSRGDQRANPQWATYPYTMLRHLAARRRATEADLLAADGPYRARAFCVPRFLADHRQSLLAERDRGRVAHRSFVESIADHELPAARDFLATLDVDAARACDTHADFLRDEVLGSAPAANILGPDEYAERLRLSYRITRPLEDLVAEARDALARTHEEMIAAAREIRSGTTISDFSDVRTLMIALQRETFAPGEDIAGRYRTIMDEAMAQLAARGEFDLVDVDEMGMDDYPEGMRDQGPGTNWPAPLLDDDAPGQFVIHPDPQAHSRAWASVLAVHEGMPGHYLQSREFRRSFRGTRAPVRFLCVADDVAIPRLNFASMLSIEGWAVYAEELVRESGFLRGVDALFALAAHALRAVRVIAEVELHRGTLRPEDVENFVTGNAGLPSARWELQRYQRGPMQAVAYFFGAREIRELRRRTETRLGGAFDAKSFHGELLRHGPVLPSSVGSA